MAKRKATLTEAEFFCTRVYSNRSIDGTDEFIKLIDETEEEEPYNYDALGALYYAHEIDMTRVATFLSSSRYKNEKEIFLNRWIESMTCTDIDKDYVYNGLIKRTKFREFDHTVKVKTTKLTYDKDVLYKDLDFNRITSAIDFALDETRVKHMLEDFIKQNPDIKSYEPILDIASRYGFKDRIYTILLLYTDLTYSDFLNTKYSDVEQWAFGISQLVEQLSRISSTVSMFVEGKGPAELIASCLKIRCDFHKKHGLDHTEEEGCFATKKIIENVTKNIPKFAGDATIERILDTFVHPREAGDASPEKRRRIFKHAF